VPFTITGGGGAPLDKGPPEHRFYHWLKVTVADGQVQVELHRMDAAP
jgi:hypothetical protein